MIITSPLMINYFKCNGHASYILKFGNHSTVKGCLTALFMINMNLLTII